MPVKEASVAELTRGRAGFVRDSWLWFVYLASLILVGLGLSLSVSIKPSSIPLVIPLFTMWLFSIVIMLELVDTGLGEESRYSRLIRVDSFNAVIVNFSVASYMFSILYTGIILPASAIIAGVYFSIMFSAERSIKWYIKRIWFVESRRIKNVTLTRKAVNGELFSRYLIDLLKYTSDLYPCFKCHLERFLTFYHMLWANMSIAVKVILFLSPPILITIFLLKSQLLFMTATLITYTLLLASAAAFIRDYSMIREDVMISSFYSAMLSLNIVEKTSSESRNTRTPVLYVIDRADWGRKPDNSISRDEVLHKHLYEILLNAAFPMDRVNTIILILSEEYLMENEKFWDILVEKLKSLPSDMDIAVIKTCGSQECMQSKTGFTNINGRVLDEKRGGPRLYSVEVYHDYSYIILAIGRILDIIGKESIHANMIIDLRPGRDILSDAYFALIAKYILLKYKGIAMELYRVLGLVDSSIGDGAVKFLSSQSIKMEPPYRKYILQDILAVLEGAGHHMALVLREEELKTNSSLPIPPVFPGGNKAQHK